MAFRLHKFPVFLAFGMALWMGGVCHAQFGDFDLYKPFKVLAAPFDAMHRKKPRTGHDSAIERLAEEIDWLEHHIDRYGTIVAKHPDVWGESRLMRHRYEYEQQMAAQLDRFEVRMNAALRRSDQAFLGMAFALQAAAGTDASGQPVQVPTVQQTDNSLKIVNGMTSSPNASGGTANAPVNRTKPFDMMGDSATSLFDSSTNLSLEPTIQLDQMSRYLNHLHELRRINEGDDIADSPGYSLNLVRIPVSIVTGKQTRKGYGAEITIIAQPNLTPDLLPKTFRDLVINDLVDLLGPAVTFLVNDDTMRDIYKCAEQQSRGKGVLPELDTNSQLRIEAANALEAALGKATSPLPAGRSRRARLPMPRSQLKDVLSAEGLTVISVDAWNRLRSSPVNRTSTIHLMDVESYLREELNAAYEYLLPPSQRRLWNGCSHYLAMAIRRHDYDVVKTTREAVFDNDFHNKNPTVTSALAWAILVEASLLNERLNEDVRDVLAAEGGIAMAAPSMPFYLPNPPAEAVEIFNEYVRRRWPIRVFALDPVTQDQNVADDFARRRELQVAAALAFASGRMNAQALMRFTRRLEWDMATIQLNRTQIGFSHGNDTFGWRFYPRFQTPPVPGNLRAFSQSLFGGPSRDAELRSRELENGIRECTAIVVMPSFVHSVIFDVRTNWFKLTDPKSTEISMKETMKLSRSIKAMQQSAAMCAQCAHLYRDGEVARLLRRVDQLDRELPLQTMVAQVPYENTAGGFELFNRGITDLAPELVGWYGAPGIDPNSPTTMYLIGDGFSVHDTRVVAGGCSVPFKLLSRQVMQVEIPAGVQVLSRGNPLATDEPTPRDLQEVVDVHLATPYGISSHLLVPVSHAGNRVAGAGTLAFRPGAVIQVDFSETAGTEPINIDEFFRFNQDAVVIRVPRTLSVADTATITFSVWDPTQPATFLGKFEVAAVPLNHAAYEYYLIGAKLSNLVSQINNFVEPYLKWKKARGFPLNSLTVDVFAELPGPVPVKRSFKVEYTKK